METTTFSMKPSIDHAPLVPLAIALSCGVVVGHWVSTSIALGMILVPVGILLWFTKSKEKCQPLLALLPLWTSIFGIGVLIPGFESMQRNSLPIRDLAMQGPQLLYIKCTIVDAPAVSKNTGGPLVTFPQTTSTTLVVFLQQIKSKDQWRQMRGLLQLRLPGNWHKGEIGDELEVFGRLSPLPKSGNPGELDPSIFFKSRGIVALFTVQHTSDGVKLTQKTTVVGSLNFIPWIRNWGQTRIKELIPEKQQNLAQVLLLGDQNVMNQDDWTRFQRTGVVHVLAISGQHLFILAIFLEYILRMCIGSTKIRALTLSLFLFYYALLTGGHVPVMRACLMVILYMGSKFVRRPPVITNNLALAWLILCVFSLQNYPLVQLIGGLPTSLVIPFNSNNVFQIGVHLSFLSIALLIWGTTWIKPRGIKPLEKVKKESQSISLKFFYFLRSFSRKVLNFNLVTLIIWLGLAPLIAARFHLVSPIGLLIGPPIIILTSLALLSGFLMLFFSAFLLPPVAWVFAQITWLALAGCDGLIGLVENWPGAYWYVPGPPDWWLVGFYFFLLSGITLQLLRIRWVWVLAGLLIWLCIGLSLYLSPPIENGFRCTFLAVGHGSCVIVETGDGQTILYDVGAITGPQVTRKQIAPYLWSRGIRRIDEILLSHADLDHFNGLSALAERFAIGQVSCTPTFSARESKGVEETLKALKWRGIKMRQLKAGDRLTAGKILFQVLHPPALGPSGKENVRSLVLLLTVNRYSILLTGDLEAEGLDMVLALPPVQVDVLMAPHHGSRLANTEEFAEWARPRAVISCQGPPKNPVDIDPYQAKGARFLTTNEHGAITIQVDQNRLMLATFRTGERWSIPNRFVENVVEREDKE